MPTRKQRFNSNQVEDFRLAEARRRNNLPAGIAPIYEPRERQTVQHAYDSHLDPQLQWAGKAEHTSFELDVVSLHIHERISTRAILNEVTRPITSAIGLLRRNATAGRPADRVLPARSGLGQSPDSGRQPGGDEIAF